MSSILSTLLGLALVVSPSSAPFLPHPSRDAAPLLSATLLAIAVASLAAFFADGPLGSGPAVFAGVGLAGVSIVTAFGHVGAYVPSVIAAGLCFCHLLLVRKPNTILASRIAPTWLRAFSVAAAVALVLIAIIALYRHLNASQLAIPVVSIDAIAAAGVLVFCAACPQHGAWWPGIAVVWVVAVGLVAGLARNAEVIRPAADRRDLLLILGLAAVVALVLILAAPNQGPGESPMLRTFLLFRMGTAVTCIGFGLAWLFSSRHNAIPIALVAFGGFALTHVLLTQTYVRWRDGGRSSLPEEKMAELRVLGFRESAVLSVSTPGVVLGLIGALGKTEAGVALQVAAVALATAICLGLVLHGLVAVGQLDSPRARMLVTYVQVLNLWSLTFGLICVALSLFFPGGKSQ